MAAEWTAKDFEPIAFARPLILGYCLGAEELREALKLALRPKQKDFSALEYALDKAPGVVLDDDKTAHNIVASLARRLPPPDPSPKRTEFFRLAFLAARATGIEARPPSGLWKDPEQRGSWSLRWYRSDTGILFAFDSGAAKANAWPDWQDWQVDIRRVGYYKQREKIHFVHRELLARFREHRGRATWLCPPTTAGSAQASAS